MMPCSYSSIQEGIVLLYPNEMFPSQSKHTVKEMAIRYWSPQQQQLHVKVSQAVSVRIVYLLNFKIWP